MRFNEGKSSCCIDLMISCAIMLDWYLYVKKDVPFMTVLAKFKIQV